MTKTERKQQEQSGILLPFPAEHHWIEGPEPTRPKWLAQHLTWVWHHLVLVERMHAEYRCKFGRKILFFSWIGTYIKRGKKAEKIREQMFEAAKWKKIIDKQTREKTYPSTPFTFASLSLAVCVVSEEGGWRLIHSSGRAYNSGPFWRWYRPDSTSMPEKGNKQKSQGKGNFQQTDNGKK